MAIRYTQKLNKEIYRTVYEFNKKVKELEKMDGVLVPNKITTKELKNTVYDRRELRRELKNLKLFLKPGAEQIVQTQAGVTSKYDIAIFKSNLRSAKARVNAKLQRLYNTELYIEGKTTGQTYATMGDTRWLNLMAKKKTLSEIDINKLSREQFKRYTKMVERLAMSDKNREWKENYLDLLLKTGYEYGVDKDITDNIKNKMMKLSPKDFMKVYNKSLEVQTVTEYYRMMKETIDSGISISGLKDNVESLYKNLSDKIDLIVKN